MNTRPINSDMTIGTVVKEHPETAEVLLSYGLQCVGCAVNPYETIEQGAMGHGMQKETIESLVDELNLVVTKKPDYELNPAGITLSPNALDALEAIAETEGQKGFGLKVEATKHGKNLDYFLDLVEKPEGEEKTLEWQGWNIFVTDKSLSLMKPSVIDFVTLPSGEGFKIISLREEESCPCGKPISECGCKGKPKEGGCGGACSC